jgi:hypothetical protein
VVTLDDVAAIALDLPETTEGEARSGRSWAVRGKTFAWERQFSKADLRRFGADPVPQQPVLAVRLDDLGEKEAVLAANHRGYFTIPHFDGYAAVLVELRLAGKKVVRDTLVDGWLACAPPALVESYMSGRRSRR